MKLKLKVDNRSIMVDNNGNACLKLSSDANQGLSFDQNGRLIATKNNANVDGNTPGNALGPITATASTSLPILGFNSTVSRHLKCTDTSRQFAIENDGPVMTKMDGTDLADDCVAKFMVNYFSL